MLSGNYPDSLKILEISKTLSRLYKSFPKVVFNVFGYLGKPNVFAKKLSGLQKLSGQQYYQTTYIFLSLANPFPAISNHFKPISCHFKPFIAIYLHFQPFPAISIYLQPFLAMSSYFKQFLAISSQCLPFTASYSNLNPFPASNRHLQSICSHIHRVTAIYSHLQTFPAIYSHLLQLSAIYSHIQPFPTISSPLQPSSKILQQDYVESTHTINVVYIAFIFQMFSTQLFITTQLKPFLTFFVNAVFSFHPRLPHSFQCSSSFLYAINIYS